LQMPAIDVEKLREATGWGGGRVTVALSAKVVNSRQAEVRWRVTWVRLEPRYIRQIRCLTNLRQSGRD
jgi:hypothetical protein